jgi:hypothetical protein
VLIKCEIEPEFVRAETLHFVSAAQLMRSLVKLKNLPAPRAGAMGLGNPTIVDLDPVQTQL